MAVDSLFLSLLSRREKGRGEEASASSSHHTPSSSFLLSVEDEELSGEREERLGSHGP